MSGRASAPGTRSLRQVFLYFLTIAAGQGLSFVLLPIVTNYLTPSAYGDYAVALAISGFIGTLGSSWVRNVGFRLFFEARRARRTAPFFVSVAVGQAAIVVVLFVAAAALLPSFDHYVPRSVILAAATAVIAGDFLALTLHLLRAEQKAAHFAVAEIGTSAVRFVTTLVGLLLGARSSHLLFLATSVGAAAAGIYAFRALKPTLTGGARLELRMFQEVARYAPAALPFSVSVWVERMVDRLILDHHLTRDVVGIYSANYGLADRIVGGLSAGVFMMAWPDIVRSWTDGGKRAARDASTRAMTLFFWVTFGPAVFVAVFSRELAAVLGPAYRSGAEIMPFIAAAAWLVGFKSYLNRQFELQLRFGTISTVTFVGAALNVVLNLLLIPRFGVRGAAFATLGNYVATATIFWLMRDRELVRLPLRDIATVVLLTCCALVASQLAMGTRRAVVFVVVYSAGAGLFVFRQFRRFEPRLAPRETRAPSTDPSESRTCEPRATREGAGHTSRV